LGLAKDHELEEADHLGDEVSKMLRAFIEIMSTKAKS